MDLTNKSFLQTTPFIQSGVLLIIGVVSMVLVSAASGGGSFVWTVVLSTVLLFSTISPIFSIFQERILSYLLQSIGSFFLLVLIMVLLAQQLSNIQIETAGYLINSLLGLTVFYFMMIGLAILYRNILLWLKGEADRPIR